MTQPNKFSARITQQKSQGASQAMLYATGMTEADMDKPQVGISSVWYEGNPCNMHLLDLANAAKDGVVAGAVFPDVLEFELGRQVEVDLDRDERMNAKIRDAQLRKVPYMLVVGDREAEAQAAALRIRGGGDVGSVPVTEILSRLRKERDEKSLTLWG